MTKMRNANNIFVGRPEGKRPLEKPRHTWDGYIRMDLRETVWEGVGLDSSGSGYGPVAGFCENGNEPSFPQKEGNFLTS
jgi:hypothetical protein